MTDNFNPKNSIWPNGSKMDENGYVTFYPLGTNKIDVPTTGWPKGTKLVAPFVYDENNHVVGFCDTKAMTTANGNANIYLPYELIQADFSSIEKGTLGVYAPKAVVKNALWADGTVSDFPEAQYKYKGCQTLNDVTSVDADYKTTDIVDGVWSEPLWSLSNGDNMFDGCDNLTSFSTDLPMLYSAVHMFRGCPLTSFTSDLSSLTNGYNMFYYCENLESFSSDLSSLTNGIWMFSSCSKLTSFSSDLSNLTNGYKMFRGCKLDTASVQNIADTINNYNGGTIDIDIANSEPNEEENAAFEQIASKGWDVYVNGSLSYKGEVKCCAAICCASLATLDEDDTEHVAPKPYWAKPVPATEETASYVDANGNYYNILGGQYIYVRDPETYGMFTSLEDAQAQMRLTKYVKGEEPVIIETA